MRVGNRCLRQPGWPEQEHPSRAGREGRALTVVRQRHDDLLRAPASQTVENQGTRGLGPGRPLSFEDGDSDGRAFRAPSVCRRAKGVVAQLHPTSGADMCAYVLPCHADLPKTRAVHNAVARLCQRHGSLMGLLPTGSHASSLRAGGEDAPDECGPVENLADVAWVSGYRCRCDRSTSGDRVGA